VYIVLLHVLFSLSHKSGLFHELIDNDVSFVICIKDEIAKYRAFIFLFHELDGSVHQSNINVCYRTVNCIVES